MKEKKTSRNSRRGATAVEFAMVLPVVLLISFGLIEITRAQTIRESARTAMIVGAREASILRTDANRVRTEIERMLNPLGVNSRSITVTPEVIDPSVDAVSIVVEVPYNAANGNLAGRFMGGKTVRFSSVVAR